MTRLSRLEEHRYVGARDTMRVYDTDDGDQSEALAARIESDDLINRLQIQTFGPDSLDEARNRGFKPA